MEFHIKMKDQVTCKVKNRKVNESNTFSKCDGVLMFADRIIIPISFRKCMLRNSTFVIRDFLELNP